MIQLDHKQRMIGRFIIFKNETIFVINFLNPEKHRGFLKIDLNKFPHER